MQQLFPWDSPTKTWSCRSHSFSYQPFFECLFLGSHWEGCYVSCGIVLCEV